jgi:hypothetical protein
MYYHSLNPIVATRLGVACALIAQILHDESTEGDWAQIREHSGRIWVRTSYRMLAGVAPYLSAGQVRRICRRLMSEGIIKRRTRLGDDPFDSTNWYSFTAAGELLMVAESQDEAVSGQIRK